jgi:hypothetical protein
LVHQITFLSNKTVVFDTGRLPRLSTLSAKVQHQHTEQEAQAVLLAFLLGLHYTAQRFPSISHPLTIHLKRYGE